MTELGKVLVVNILSFFFWSEYFPEGGAIGPQASSMIPKTYNRYSHIYVE